MMSSSINMSEIMMSSLLGILLSAMVLFAVAWHSNDNSKETRYIKTLLISVLVTEIASPLTFLADGDTLLFSKIVLRLTDIIIYSSNVVIGLLWLNIVTTHLNVKISKANRITVMLICVVATLLLIITQFTPIVYGYTENNSYYRGPLAFLYNLIEVFFSIDGIIIYIRSKKVGGVLKFFPVWQFALPVVIGAIIQMQFYGITITIPCVAISMLGLMLGLQNDRIYSDELTGAYNRFYLDHIRDELKGKAANKFTIMMVDLKGFRRINSQFGFEEGDRVLRDTASILTGVVGSLGSVIRYSGDEFVIILNTDKPDQGAYTILNVKRQLFDYNNNSGNGYELVAAIGSCIVDIQKLTIDDVMKLIR